MPGKKEISVDDHGAMGVEEWLSSTTASNTVFLPSGR
jgi:hypothetical protein